MADQMVSAEAAGILTLMLDASQRLPQNWEMDCFWLSGAQWLAQFIADNEGKIPTEDLGCLLGIGGQMIVMAQREREADSLTHCLLNNLRDDGGAHG